MDRQPKGIDIRHPISRREFLIAFPIITAAFIYFFRYEIRQFVKDALHGTPLYNTLARIEEDWLSIFGNPSEVTTYNYSIAKPKKPSTREVIKNIGNAQSAVDFFHNYSVTNFESSQEHDDKIGVDFLNFKLPTELADNIYVQTVLGTSMTTPNGEKLSNNALATRVLFPLNTQTIIAPAVPIPGGFPTNSITGRYTQGDYNALSLFPTFYSQTIISEGHKGNIFESVQIVPNAERMIIEGRDVKGSEFARGAIKNYSVFLIANGSSWRLAEWPDPIFSEPNAGCAHLFWNLNPRNKSGKRIFTPVPPDFRVEQDMQLNGYVNHLVTHADYEHVGPTCVFRTDAKTGQHDMIFIAPFLFLVAPHILQKILLYTPIGTSTIPTIADDIILAMPDAKFNTMYGSHPAVLSQANSDRYAINTLEYPVANTKVSDFFSMNNTIAFYAGAIS